MKVNIIEDDVNKQIDILRSLATTGQEVDVEIEASLSDLKELLKHTAETPITIKKLRLKEEDLRINDDNVAEFTETFASLPTFEEAECSGKIHTTILKGESDASSLLKELSRNKFNIYSISLNHNFRQSEISAAYDDAINSVFQNCRVENYIGHLTPQMTAEMFQHLNGQLFATMMEDESFSAFRDMIIQRNWGELRWLRFCISPKVDPEILLPLPGYLWDPPQLWVRDVDEESIENAVNVAQKLKPTDGCREFYHMYFPRCQLSTEGLRKLLSGLRVKVGPIPGHVIISTNCRPSSQEEQQQLNSLGYIIKWGHNGNMDVFNTDSW